MKRIATAIVVLILSTFVFAADWPQWRGPNGNGVSDEKGYAAEWPKVGPKRIWTAKGIGKGYSSPIIANNTIYITGDFASELKIFALAADGTKKWETANGKSWKKSFPGSRSCCTYSDDLLYHMNAHGRVACFDPADGKEKWSVDIMDKYAAKHYIWGFSEAILVLEKVVVVTPASAKAQMVALDRKTGKEVWVTPSISGEKASYSSAIVVERDGKRQIINCTLGHSFGVDPENGKLLWKCAHVMKGSQVLTTPSYCGGRLFVPSTHRTGSRSYMVKLQNGRGKVDWYIKNGNPTGSTIFTDGLLFANGSREPKGWSVYDPASNKPLATKGDLPYGAAVRVDGKYYCLTSNGKMLLMDVKRSGIKAISQFEYQSGKKDVWAHPVVCGGRLYLRYHDQLHCYDVSGK